MKVASLVFRVGSLIAALGLVASAARAAEIGPPQSQRETPDQARCKALGEGYFAVKGSTACIRISGYVSAGMGFVAPGRIAAPTTGPFAPHNSAYSTTEGAAAVETQFDTAFGPGRLYVQVGGLNVNH
jgi:hypothetical protein